MGINADHHCYWHFYVSIKVAKCIQEPLPHKIAQIQNLSDFISKLSVLLFPRVRRIFTDGVAHYFPRRDLPYVQ